MCGIVGFTGARQAGPILLEGLRRLEYRGYDSAGVAVQDDGGKIRAVKASGRLEHLCTMTREGGGRPRHLWHRTYPLGHSRGAYHNECPSPPV